jgi:hypothetical protein
LAAARVIRLSRRQVIQRALAAWVHQAGVLTLLAILVLLLSAVALGTRSRQL